MQLLKRNRLLQVSVAAVAIVGMLSVGPAASAAEPIPVPNGSVPAQLSDSDYIDQQMAAGNYVVTSDGTIVIDDLRPSQAAPGGISTNCVACVQGQWRIKSTSGPARVYDGWRTHASGWGPGSLSRTVTATHSNSYSGTLSVSKSVVDAAVGFNITSSFSNSITYSGNIASGKLGYLQTREVYDRYTVTQQYIKLGSVIDTKYVYPRKYLWTENRIGY